MKKITFYKSFEKQREDSLSYSKHLTYFERLEECLKLTRKAFWKYYQSDQKKEIKKNISVYKGKKGEALEEFYKRIRTENGFV